MSSSSINNNQPLPSPPSNNIPENTKLDEVEQVIDTSSLFRSKKRSRANPSTSTNAGGNLRKRGRDAAGSTLGVSRGSSGWDDEVTHSAVVQRDDKRSSANRNSFHNGKGAQEEGDSLEEENGLHVLFKADSSASLTSTKGDNISGATAVNSLESGTFNIEGNDIKVENVAARTDSSYSGQSGYNTYLQKREGTGDSKMKAGPIRAPSHLRVTSRFDYQPDICKDYKGNSYTNNKTGFCGYGDSCKFLHDRGDYKAGWQLDQEWEEAQKMKLKRQAQLYRNIELGETGDQDQSDNDSGSDDEEELPFACLICRQPFVTPVVTKCGHYFCERCALKNHVATPKCFACGANTQGIFDVAKKLLDKLDQAKACNATDDEGSQKNDGLVEDEPVDEF